MKEEKKRLIRWIKTHKKELVISGIGISSIIATVLILNNKDDLVAVVRNLYKKINYTQAKTIVNAHEFNNTPLVESLNESHLVCDIVEKIYSEPFDVKPHLRNLAPGCFASAEKIATAAENNYILSPGQTWVNAYSKGSLAA